jgi:hypothetical protein
MLLHLSRKEKNMSTNSKFKINLKIENDNISVSIGGNKVLLNEDETDILIDELDEKRNKLNRIEIGTHVRINGEEFIFSLFEDDRSSNSLILISLDTGKNLSGDKPIGTPIGTIYDDTTSIPIREFERLFNLDEYMIVEKKTKN